MNDPFGGRRAKVPASGAPGDAIGGALGICVSLVPIVVIDSRSDFGRDWKVTVTVLGMLLLLPLYWAGSVLGYTLWLKVSGFFNR